MKNNRFIKLHLLKTVLWYYNVTLRTLAIEKLMRQYQLQLKNLN